MKPKRDTAKSFAKPAASPAIAPIRSKRRWFMLRACDRCAADGAKSCDCWFYADDRNGAFKPISEDPPLFCSVAE